MPINQRLLTLRRSGDYTPFAQDRVRVNAYPIAYTASIELNAKLGEEQTVALGGNIQISAFRNMKRGPVYVQFTQDGVGGRTLTLPGSVRQDAGAVVLATAANAWDIVEFLQFNGVIYARKVASSVSVENNVDGFGSWRQSGANLSIPNASFVGPNFNTPDPTNNGVTRIVGTGGFRYVVEKSGLWLVNIGVQWAHNLTGHRSFTVNDNLGTINRTIYHNPNPVNDFAIPDNMYYTSIFNLNANQNINLTVRQTSGANLDLTTGSFIEFLRLGGNPSA